MHDRQVANTPPLRPLKGRQANCCFPPGNGAAYPTPSAHAMLSKWDPRAFCLVRGSPCAHLSSRGRDCACKINTSRPSNWCLNTGTSLLVHIPRHRCMPEASLRGNSQTRGWPAGRRAQEYHTVHVANNVAKLTLDMDTK